MFHISRPSLRYQESGPSFLLLPATWHATHTTPMPSPSGEGRDLVFSSSFGWPSPMVWSGLPVPDEVLQYLEVPPIRVFWIARLTSPLRPLCLWCPYQGLFVPNNTVPKIIGAHKPLPHSTVAINGRTINLNLKVVIEYFIPDHSIGEEQHQHMHSHWYLPSWQLGRFYLPSHCQMSNCPPPEQKN